MALDCGIIILDRKYSPRLVVEAEVGRTELRQRIVGKGNLSVREHRPPSHRGSAWWLLSKLATKQTQIVRKIVVNFRQTGRLYHVEVIKIMETCED